MRMAKEAKKTNAFDLERGCGGRPCVCIVVLVAEPVWVAGGGLLFEIAIPRSTNLTHVCKIADLVHPDVVPPG